MTAPTLDLTHAGDVRSLPARAYTDPSVLAEETESLFLKGWHFAAHISELPEIGSYVTLSIFDQKILVTRRSDTELAAFYNVCPHRGHLLAEGRGRASRIVCPYHTWTYALDGRLVGLRGYDGGQAFAKSDICLTSVAVDQFLDFVFVNLDADATPMADLYPGLEGQIRTAIPDLDTYRPRGDDLEYFGGAYQANWKVLVDNYLECYHCEAAHPSFVDMVDVAASTFEICENHTHQVLPWTGRTDNKAYPINSERDVLEGRFWYLFPHLTLSVFPGAKNFAISEFVPDGPATTSRKFRLFAPDGTDAKAEAARSEWGLSVVNEEDKRLCESVQQGYAQRGFDRGYYLVRPDAPNLSEEGLRFFHRCYAQSMRGT